MNRKFWALNGVLAVIAAVLILLGFLTIFNKASASTTNRTATVERGTVSQSVTTTSNISPVQMETLNFSTSGIISAIDVSVGQNVTQGQVLATLDTTSADAALTAAEDQLTAAKDNLSLIESGGETPPQKAEDTQSLDQDQTAVTNAQNTLNADETSGASASQIDQDQSALTQAQNALSNEQLAINAKRYVSPSSVASAEATVAQAESSVNTAEQTVGDTVLKAPFSGTITAIPGTVGESVSGGGSQSTSTSSDDSSSSESSSSTASTSSSSSSTSSSSGVMTIANMSQLVVDADFPEADAVKLAVGDEATVTLEALTNVTIAGTVTSISDTSQVSSDVVTYPVTITLTNAPSEVKDGMTVDAAVIVASDSNVLYLPTAAITTTGGLSTVTVIGANGKKTTQTITTGLVGDTDTVVTSGLSQGEEVVLPTASITSSSTSTNSSTTRSVGGFGGTGGFGGAGGFGGFGG